MYEPKSKNFDLKTPDKSALKALYDLEELETTKVICEGFWRGRHFVIGKNHFCVPVIYVEWRGTEPPGDEYFGEAYWLPEDQRDGTMYYGWDHGHAWDWCPTDFRPDRRWNTPDPEKYAEDHHKWSIAEMLMEIAAWIEWNSAYENQQIEDEIEKNLE